MIKISVTRGLVQLKRLETRIQKDISSIENFVIINRVQEKNVLNGTMTKEVFTNDTRSQWQSLKDKLTLRQEIKDAIVKSNASTTVDIAGKEYTVAQAIEKKNNIEKFELPISRKLNQAYSKAMTSVEFKNEDINDAAERTFLGRGEDKKKNDNNSDLLDAMQIYIDSRKYEIVDPLNMKSLRENFEKEILDFIAEVDQVLTESNSTTMIEISKNPSEL